jgi:hypothetical protein
MAGRPLKFKTPEELEKKINDYFDQADEKGEPYVFAALALFLDTTRETISDYQEKDIFSDSIKKAKLRILAEKEKMLLRTNGQIAGVIFDLKNNYKQYYADDSNLHLMGKGDNPVDVTINILPVKPKDES